MKEILKEKIILILTNENFPENNEQIVYLFVQIRKYLELENTIENYTDNEKILKLYSDWLLHNDLSFQLTQNFLGKFADDYDKEDGFSKLENSRSLIRCDNLYQAIEDLCEKLDIEFPFKNSKKWWRFLFILIKELANIPLIHKERQISFKFSNVQSNEYRYEFKYNDFSSSGSFILKLKNHAHESE